MASCDNVFFSKFSANDCVSSQCLLNRHIYFDHKLKRAVCVLNSGGWVYFQSSLGVLMGAGYSCVVLAPVVTLSQILFRLFLLDLRFKFTSLISSNSNNQSSTFAIDMSLVEAQNLNEDLSILCILSFE